MDFRPFPREAPGWCRLGFLFSLPPTSYHPTSEVGNQEPEQRGLSPQKSSGVEEAGIIWVSFARASVWNSLSTRLSHGSTSGLKIIFSYTVELELHEKAAQ